MQELRGDFLHAVSDSISPYIRAIVCREDLSRKYVFENIDSKRLKDEPQDSPGFIKFCEIYEGMDPTSSISWLANDYLAPSEAPAEAIHENSRQHPVNLKEPARSLERSI
jgi:hypothetical protein